MINVYELIIDLGKPKSVASFIYLAVVNNYTVIQHVTQISDDFVVSAVSKINGFPYSNGKQKKLS